MPTVMNMPEVMANATEATLHIWLKREGDTVSAGEAIAEVETEKATVEVEVDADGLVARLLVDAGTNVDVGMPIAVIRADGDSDDDVLALLASLGSKTAEPTTATSDFEREKELIDTPRADQTSETAPSNRQTSENQGLSEARIFTSPLARRIARENDLDISAISGSGPGGRIVRRDVETAVAEQTSSAILSPPAAGPPKAASPPEQAAPTSLAAAEGNYETMPHSRMRQAIASRLTESKSTVPHFYLRADVRMDELLTLRKKVNESTRRKLTVNDLIVKAAGLALQDVPAANVIWTEEARIQFSSSDISVAIAVDDGLLTPVVHNVESASVSSISATVRDYVERAKAGKLRQTELTGGSFCVTNLGMFDTREFTAILNPPQSGILAVGAAERRAVVIDGELGIATQMSCTLSADHRVIDGAVAAQWMQAFTAHIESPLSLLI